MPWSKCNNTKEKLMIRMKNLVAEIKAVRAAIERHHGRLKRLECNHKWVPQCTQQEGTGFGSPSEWRVTWYCFRCESHRTQPISELTDAQRLALRELGFDMPEEKP